jgi:hypothetical protein
MNNFCTLFDSNYIVYGLNLYKSLVKTSSNFFLYIFAFDDECYEILSRLNLPHARIISLKEFEDSELLHIKSTRTKGEYCWTCTPSTILYCLKQFNIDRCTYLDSDLFFLQNPAPIFEEMGENSVLITPHRYTPKYDQSKESGIYCVQFMTFKNDAPGLKALTWWRDACIKWCYARIEDGKFGDQKYLDDWTERFEKVYSCNNIGVGVAPWNIQQYEISSTSKGIIGREKRSGKQSEIIFYHFHGLKFLKNNKVDLGEYELDKNVLSYIYIPYLKCAKESLRDAFASEDLGSKSRKNKPGLKQLYKILRRVLEDKYNVFDVTKLLEKV